MESDKETNISILKNKIREFAKVRGWEKFHHPKELAISLSLEAAELLELFQWKEKESIEAIKKNKELMEKLSEELADVMIYALHIANETGIDVSEAVIKKIGKNAKKYPVEKSLGNNKKYTDL